MMVNPMFNENSLPWQSTVPQTMPWMGSHELHPSAMPFGQASVPNSHLHTSSIATHQNQSGPSHVASPTQFGIPSISQPICPSCPTDVDQNFSKSIIVDPHRPSVSQDAMIAPTTSTYNPTMICPPSDLSFTNVPEPCGSHRNKRSSFDMEDEPQEAPTEPPSKQQLSERKLFKKFGSLQLNVAGRQPSDSESDDSEGEDKNRPVTKNTFTEGREEFNKYVYLLFQDNGKSPMQPSYSTIERLAREEREKMSKALVLWSPPLTSLLVNQNQSSSDDEDFNYKDHRDFLKSNDDSVAMSE